MSRAKKRKDNPQDNSINQNSFREYKPEDYENVNLPEQIPQELSDTSYEEIQPEFLAVVQPVRERLLAAKQKLEQQFIYSVTERAFSAYSGTTSYGFENIIGVGISEKITNHNYTGKQCVTVYVVSKESESSIAPEAMVPKEINGIPTDVVATGEIRAFPHKGTYRPAPGGVSIGHYQITAGTLGCLVRRGNALYVLSNNHVLANVNQGHTGDPILQPGPYDGGVIPGNVIAQLSEFVPIDFSGQSNFVDAAIAQASPTLVTPINKCFGAINPNPLGAQRFMVVKKCGRTTQASIGLITDVDATVRVGYGNSGSAVFTDQMIIVGVSFALTFSAPGDSGSLILSQIGNRPVGLLFAGSTFYTIANKIGNVLSALNISIVS